ncbi:Hpt domain-containing protein [Candidatus Binatia bacterium]|nr:Hpt domain-containing protein [Candidatus Binatia bacterium]
MKALDGVPEDRKLDEAAMLEQFEGDRELLLEIVGLFLEDCPRRLTVGRRAVAAGDMATLVRVAHSLKGSAANFGGKAASAAALAVETAALAGDATAAAAAWERLETEIAWLTANLEQWD